MHLVRRERLALARRLAAIHTATATDLHPRPSRSPPDPFLLLAPQLSSIRLSLLSLLPSGHPALTQITRYYFQHPSKQIRPLIVLLFSLATNGLGAAWDAKLTDAIHGPRDDDGLHAPLTRRDVLNDWNPALPAHTAAFSPSFPCSLPFPSLPSATPQHAHISHMHTTRTLPTHPPILPTQTRLAQIVEMMHTASLLHDDVIDHSSLRRGSPSAPASFGNKLSVLGGNFVLGRASAMLARLGDDQVTRLIAGIISDLVEGEVLQMKGEAGDATLRMDSDSQPLDSPVDIDTPKPTQADAWRTYLQKTYLKTASLMAKGARAAVTLGGCGDPCDSESGDGGMCREIAYAYGRNLGIAFQLIDDALDYESSPTSPTHATPVDLGKPGGADLHLGLATGPALYAWEEHPRMGELVRRRFRGVGDVELAKHLVQQSSALHRTRALARVYAEKAKEVIGGLPESEAKGALGVLADRVVGRRR